MQTIPNKNIQASITTVEPGKVRVLMEYFCAPGGSNHLMQSTIRELAREVISTAQGSDLSSLDGATLIPILRGGLPMIVGAQSCIPSSTCVLVRCFKSKGTQEVGVEWLGRGPFPRQIDEGGPIVLLDTIIATGDTIMKLCDELLKMPGCASRSVVIMSCYAAPAALQRLANHAAVRCIIVAKQAERCDDKGYLVPYTNGDIGDKIYGAKNDSEVDT